jgi:hypothetical protein
LEKHWALFPNSFEHVVSQFSSSRFQLIFGHNIIKVEGIGYPFFEKEVAIKLTCTLVLY